MDKNEIMRTFYEIINFGYRKIQANPDFFRVEFAAAARRRA